MVRLRSPHSSKARKQGVPQSGTTPQVDSPSEILKALKQAKRILIPLHVNVDGDSVGTALALYHLLKGWGKNVKVISADPIPENLLFLPGAKKIGKTDPARLNLTKYDLLLLTDLSEHSRFSRKEDFRLPRGMTTVNIDHHPPVAGETFSLRYTNSQASSAAELLFDLFKNWKIKVTPQIAECLLTGIITDTGRFQYRSTTPEALEKAAELMRLGADHSKIILQVYRSWPLPVLTLWATLLNNAKLRRGILYTTLSQDGVKRLKISHADLSTARAYAASEFLRTIEGTKVAALFTDEGEKIHVNLRSRGEFNVGKIAETLGGGGHARTAAFEFKGKMKDAIDETLKLLSND